MAAGTVQTDGGGSGTAVDGVVGPRAAGFVGDGDAASTDTERRRRTPGGDPVHKTARE